MNRTEHRRLRIAARNEGKIKSYESCIDVRAWSHDIGTRNRYLRDWIKCDMPICVVPVCTLSSILSIMTCSSRARVTTNRCYSHCKSKVLLDRLCSSCTVMKECLSNNLEFEKYFRQEDLETINWPCEKCLDILKSIKMFWKIVVEKVLKINLGRQNKFSCASVSSIRNIAEEWQREMIEEALYVKSKTRVISHNDITKRESDWKNGLKMNCRRNYFTNDYRNIATETDCELKSIAVQTDGRFAREKISKCTSVSTKSITSDCKPQIVKDDEVIMIYKNNIQNLQYQCNVQRNEVDRLKKENVALNVELQRCRDKQQKSLYNTDRLLKTDDTMAIVSSPFGSKENFDFNTPKEIDSEMIITLKNCKNEHFKHVSVIQVLHKTNELNLSEINDSYFKKDDPINILNKVHETFETMVNREICIASKIDNSFINRNVVIKGSIHNIGDSRSAPSTSCYSKTSETNFESANDLVSLKSGE